jgi:hypothetical protein
METVLTGFIFLSVTPTGVLFAATFCIIALLVLFLLRRKSRRASSLNEGGLVAVKQESVSVETNPPEVINMTDIEPAGGEVPAVFREGDQKRSPVVSVWNETDSKSVFHEFIVGWLKVRGFHFRPKFFGDEVLIFQQEDSADSQTVSIGAVGVWRPGFIKGRLEWARSFQMIRYRQYEKAQNLPLFAFIGMGGGPEVPEYIYIVPLRQIRSNVISEMQLKPYLFPVDGDVVFESGFGFREKVGVGR